MKCKKCNKEILDESVFCSFCGVRQMKEPKKNKKYDYKRVTFYFDGKQYEATGKTLKEAHAKAAEKKVELENALAATGGNILVKDWIWEWLETYKVPSIGEAQYESYLTYIHAIIPIIGNKKLKDIKDIELQRILNSKTGKSKSYLSKMRMTLKSIFKQARISRYIQYDPAENLIMPQASSGSRRSITQEEREAILKLAETHHAGLWIKTMLYCGLRPGETRALDWQHIDFEQKFIKIEKAMKSSTTRIGEPKSKAGIRNVPIPDALYDELISQPEKQPYNPVFVQPTTGKRHTKTSMRCLWENFKRELDISLGAKLYRNKIIKSSIADDLVVYCLRHTYGTDLQNAGIPINIAKYLMGHSDIKMTANVYTHISEDSLIEAGEKINKYSKKGNNNVKS